MNKWHTIDTAPKDGTRILLCDWAAVYGGWWEDECWHVNCGQPVVAVPLPTHWMPLPELPPIPKDW